MQDLDIIKNYDDEIKKAILIRSVEEKLLSLFSEGKLNGTVHTCVGQEFSGVFISKYLIEDDHIVSNHRGHGHYLSRFDDIEGLIGEIMGKKCGCSGGYGGSQHLVNKNYMSNGIQGGMVPIAAGVSLFNKRMNNKNISVAYIGDGTLGEGIIYETLNIAAKWELPLLIIMENNQYAQSTSQTQTFSGNIQKRIEGFGAKYFITSTNNLFELDKVSEDGINYVRNKSKPAFIEIITSRINPHSKGDDNRDIREVDSYLSKDLLTKIVTKKNIDIYNYRKFIIDKINRIVDNLDILPSLDFSYKPKNKLSNSLLENTPELDTDLRYNSKINEALKNFLNDNQNGLMIGEDIEDGNSFTPRAYGGAFKVSKDLNSIFPDRIKNTPISEAAIVGISAGYSLKGGRTIVEIMFGDFTTLIFDQILQHISKFEIMYNRKVQCPIIIRTPMGGKRGYGPTHSQSLEKHFLGIPNFNVLVMNHRISPDYLYKAICSVEGKPFLIIENKILYTLKSSQKKIEGYNYFFSKTLFPSLIIEPALSKATFTVACYGEVLNDLEYSIRDLFIEHEVFVEVICPSIISPVDAKSVIDSVKKTNYLAIIEEGSGEASWGSEIVSILIEKDVIIKKLARFSNKYMIPSSYKAEQKILPNKENITEFLTNFINRI